MNTIRRVAASKWAAASAFVVAMVAGAAPASATGTYTDPLGGDETSIFTTLTSFLTSTLLGQVLALAVVSIAIGLVVRWVRKAVHA